MMNTSSSTSTTVVPLGRDRTVLAEDRRHAHVHLRHVLAQVLDLAPDQGPAVERAHGDQTHLAAGEFENLKRFRKLEQLHDVVAQNLLGADRVAHGEVLVGEDLRMRKVISGADAGDPGRDVEQGGGKLARHQVGLVALRHRQQQIGVARAGQLEHGRMGGVARDRPQIEPVL
jgi:hypothetical protein